MAVEISEFLAVNNFKTRPDADDGMWVLFLLPLALITSAIRHPIVLTPTYQLVSLLATGLFLTSMVISLQKSRNQRLKVINFRTVLVFIVTSTIFHISLHRDWTFSILSGAVSSIVYFKTYITVINKFEYCFTVGEAGLVSQSIVILLYVTAINIISFNHRTHLSSMQISSSIIQFGLLGIGVVALAVHKFHVRKVKSFYLLAFAVLIFVTFFPLHVILGSSPILWMLNLIFSDFATLKLIIYWSFCSGIAILAVSNQIIYARKASSSMRKIFHILALVVYIPGLLYRCCFLYLASGVVLGIFFTFEILRILNMPPLGLHLQDGFVVFSDEKDKGNLALTPIYLLAGCSLPLWIHPSPCDVTDSAWFNLLPLLSGLLSIGVGDTAASIVGSNYGKYHWKGSKKTVEGTVACILSQIGLIYFLIYCGCLETLTLEQNVKLYVAILVGSIVEAKTTQVDNLVLPLIMYTILI